MACIEFDYNGKKTIIQCNNNEKLKDIFQKFLNKLGIAKDSVYFIYGSNTDINEELTFDNIANELDKKRNKMNILVNDSVVEDSKLSIIKSPEIICPICKEISKIKINSYKITLYKCKNGHIKDNIIFNEYEKTQEIDISKIMCHACKKVSKSDAYENKFFKCMNCKFSLCPLCKSNHDKEHKIINYELKDYICDKHYDNFNSYCQNCKENICIQCEKEHSGHYIIYFGNLLPDINQYKNIMNELKGKIDLLKNNMNEIQKIFNETLKNLETYYNLYSHTINNYDNQKISYEVLSNIININKAGIIEDLNYIVNESHLSNKFKRILDIYNNMFTRDAREITIIYDINETKKKLKLFSKQFIKNNKNFCKMRLDNHEYELLEEINVEKYIQNKTLEIKLYGISNVTNMSNMFRGCDSLLSLPDISHLNTTNVTDISGMFSGCKKLKYLPDILDWNTSNINDINDLFRECESLVAIPDISNWNTTNVTNMSGLFWDCKSLEYLPDISKWNTSKVTNMNYMFSGCMSLKSLPDISKWDTSKVTGMYTMFSGCKSLSKLPDISKWNTNNVSNYVGMFNGCKDTLEIPQKFKLTNKIINSFNTGINNFGSFLSSKFK